MIVVRSPVSKALEGHVDVLERWSSGQWKCVGGSEIYWSEALAS